MNTVLSAAFLAARHGKVIELRWNLNRNNAQIGKSPALLLNVLKIADGDPRFPTPNIAGNTSTELDVRELNADALILAEKWPLFEPDQPLWVNCSGFDMSGNPVTKDVRSGEPNDSANGLSVAAPIDWLKKLKQKTELTITLKVNLDKRNIEDSSTSFPDRKYEVKNHNNLGYENWETEDISQYSEFPVNEPKTMQSGLTITTLIAPRHRPSLRLVAGYYPGKGRQTMVSGGSGASTKFALPSASKRINFYYYASHAMNRVSFYDATSQPITHKNIPPGDGVINFQSNNNCSHFIIEVHDTDEGITIDDITWDI